MEELVAYRFLPPILAPLRLVSLGKNGPRINGDVKQETNSVKMKYRVDRFRIQSSYRMRLYKNKKMG